MFDLKKTRLLSFRKDGGGKNGFYSVGGEVRECLTGLGKSSIAALLLGGEAEPTEPTEPTEPMTFATAPSLEPDFPQMMQTHWERRDRLAERMTLDPPTGGAEARCGRG